MILRPHGRPFEKNDFEVETYALESIFDEDISTKNFSIIDMTVMSLS